MIKALFDSIRDRLYLSVLHQRHRANTPRAILNLHDAQSVGLIYDATPPDHDIVITKFAEMLRNRGKKVEIMAYIDDKKIDHKGDIQIFNPKAVNWYGVPIDERVEAFASKPFDLLLCCTTTACKPIEYIAYLSPARYRIGAFAENKTDYFDLMIDIRSRPQLPYLLAQMVHYLEGMKY